MIKKSLKRTASDAAWAPFPIEILVKSSTVNLVQLMANIIFFIFNECAIRFINLTLNLLIISSLDVWLVIEFI